MTRERKLFAVVTQSAIVARGDKFTAVSLCRGNRGATVRVRKMAADPTIYDPLRLVPRLRNHVCRVGCYREIIAPTFSD